MKERPLLFGAPMIRALLAGTKTQTRRLVKPMRTAPLPTGGNWLFTGLDEHGFSGLYEDHGPLGQSVCPLPRCPYGVPGDRLWVKETWARRLDEDHLSPSQLTPGWAWYWADPQTCNTGCAGAAGKKRVSIHMPRWASRITLEVTEVRVQRLQDISEEDARAEGYPGDVMSPREWYECLWTAINGGGSWETNPFVWCLSFRRIDAT